MSYFTVGGNRDEDAVSYGALKVNSSHNYGKGRKMLLFIPRMCHHSPVTSIFPLLLGPQAGDALGFTSGGRSRVHLAALMAAELLS